MSVELSAAEALPEVAKIELWPAQRMREGLLSESSDTRVHALAMTVQPGAEVNECVAAIIACVELSRTDPIALQIAAVALSAVTLASAKPTAANCLATLMTVDNAPAVRTFAAHGIAQLALVPPVAWLNLAAMLFGDDENMRKVALRAATPFAAQGAPYIAQAAAAATPVKWTTEGLHALALSAGGSDGGKQRVEDFVLRSLHGQALIPTGIAGYTALARLNPGGVAPVALGKIAAAEDRDTALAAINALAQIGESAATAIHGLVAALCESENPEREEALCRALLALKIRFSDVPLARVLHRVATAPDRAVAAHCLLLAMHAKSLASASKVVAARHADSAPALQLVLDELHQQLVGKRLTVGAAVTAATPTP